MFGPPFGGLGGLGGTGLDGLDEMDRLPAAAFLQGHAAGLRMPGVRLPRGGQMRKPHMGGPEMGMPGMIPQQPMRGMQDPFGGLPRQRMPQPNGRGVGGLFDPSRADRNQRDRKTLQPVRRHRTPGQRSAKYEKVKSLTPGGMSVSITIIRSREDGKLYVEKKLRTDGACRKRAHSEVSALKAARGHPNLNKLIEYEVNRNGLCSIILEYCDGGSLDERIGEQAARGGHFHEKGVWHVLFSVAKALAFLHTGIKDIEKDGPDPNWNTIAHLDLKPQNIFISEGNRENGQRRIVLADFGCAVTFEDIKNGREGERAQPCGTPAWYPPEGIAGDGYGTKTDIWMLGGTVQALCLLMKAPHRPALASPMPCGSRYGVALNGMVKQLTDAHYDKRPSARRIAEAAGPMAKRERRR